jgi:hypothetical protein
VSQVIPADAATSQGRHRVAVTVLADAHGMDPADALLIAPLVVTATGQPAARGCE